VKRRWASLVNFGSFGPFFARSSLLGMGLEMIVAGLRRSKSFGLARPHTRVWHLPCPMQTAARHLHPAVDHMGCACKHCCHALDRLYAVSLTHSLLLAKDIESRHVEDRHRASRWCISHCCAFVEPRRGCSLNYDSSTAATSA
jgi:hypothetical protein